MNTDMIQYYHERAHEYERIYAKPERQNDIALAFQTVQAITKNKNVFEIACGTGFWTQFIAQSAKAVCATDINASVLDIARTKNFPPTVELRVADMYSQQRGTFDLVFGGFIFSHLLKQERSAFVQRLQAISAPNAELVLMDNNYVEGSNHPITERDEAGNTFQTRRLEDGTVHRVLKNFPNEAELRDDLSRFTENIKFVQLQYFWILSCRFSRSSKNS